MPPTHRRPTGTPFKGKIGEDRGTYRKNPDWIFEVFDFFFGVLGLKTSPNDILDLLASILH